MCVSLRQIDAPFCGGFIFFARPQKELSWLTSNSLLLCAGLEDRLTSITEACSSQTVLDMAMSESLAVRSAKISSTGGCLRARVVRLSSATHGKP